MSENKINIIQLLPTLSYGDGVGNDTLAIDAMLKDMGFSTKIYAENIDSRIKKGLVEKIDEMPRLAENDIVIYHLSTGTELNKKLNDFSGRKIIRYHNVTPARYFIDYCNSAACLCEKGRKGIKEVRIAADYCLADSEYNKQELLDNGYQCRIDVLPILIPFKNYKKKPNKKIIQKYNDDWVNIVFVGRIVPNKKQEDIIKTFFYYKKYINPKSRLILVGSYSGMERYYIKLCKYVKELELTDVIFTGHTRFDEVLAYYNVANVFLCMSEHEGFCIPLLEAMFFQIPIVAYSCTGVKETLSYAGLKFEEKNCKVVAEAIHRVITNRELKNKIVDLQNKRLENFRYEVTRTKFEKYLKEFLIYQ